MPPERTGPLTSSQYKALYSAKTLEIKQAERALRNLRAKVTLAQKRRKAVVEEACHAHRHRTLARPKASCAARPFPESERAAPINHLPKRSEMIEQATKKIDELLKQLKAEITAAANFRNALTYEQLGILRRCQELDSLTLDFEPQPDKRASGSDSAPNESKGALKSSTASGEAVETSAWRLPRQNYRDDA